VEGRVHDRSHLVSRQIADREKVSPPQFLNLTRVQQSQYSMGKKSFNFAVDHGQALDSAYRAL